MKDSYGDTALAQAAIRGSSEAAKFLLAPGAGVDISNNHGMTPLMIAARLGRTDIVRMLLTKLAAPMQKMKEIRETDTRRSGGRKPISAKM